MVKRFRHGSTLAYVILTVGVAVALFVGQHANTETRHLAKHDAASAKSSSLDACAQLNVSLAAIDKAVGTNSGVIRQIVDEAVQRSVATRAATLSSPLSTAEQKAVAQANLTQLKAEQASIDARIAAGQRTVDHQTAPRPCTYPPLSP